jgi:hypothetical protein
MKELAILKAFESLVDHRSKHGQRHGHVLCIAVFTLAVSAGCRGINAMGDWVKAYQKDLLELFEPDQGRLPSYSTLRRVLERIDYQAYAACLGSFFEVTPQAGEMVAMDGKVLRGSYEVGAVDGVAPPHSAIQLVTSYLVERQLILEPVAVDCKSNEITAMPEVVKRLASQGVKGVVFAFDALNTQKNSVNKLSPVKITTSLPSNTITAI